MKRMKKFRTLAALWGFAGLLFFAAESRGFPDVALISNTVVDTGAKTLSGATFGYTINGLSFQQEVLCTFNGWQYIAYYNGANHVCVGRRRLPAGSWQVIELADYLLSTNTDAHNVVSMGICPNDGSIHLSYDHHGHPLHYRKSVAGVATNPGSITWSASLFEANRNYLVSGSAVSSVTYPRFWSTPEGNLQFGYRAGSSGSGDWYMADYSGTTGLWSNVHQVINRYGTYSDSKITNDTDRNAYMNPPQYSTDGRLHLTWTWREGASTANHDIMYAYSEDGGNTWYNGTPDLDLRLAPVNAAQSIIRFKWLTQGRQVVGSTSPQMLITLNSPDIRAITLDTAMGTMNQQSQAIDSQGRVHTVMYHCTGNVGSIFGTVGDRRYYHHWRDSGNVWHETILPFNSGDVNTYVGSRPKLFFRPNGDAYLIYQAWQSVNLSDAATNLLYGNLVVAAATAATEWTDWRIVHVESGPFMGEALGDPFRFAEGVLSVMAQQSPTSVGQSTPLRVLDFQLID